MQLMLGYLLIFCDFSMTNFRSALVRFSVCACLLRNSWKKTEMIRMSVDIVGLH